MEKVAYAQRSLLTPGLFADHSTAPYQLWADTAFPRNLVQNRQKDIAASYYCSRLKRVLGYLISAD